MKWVAFFSANAELFSNTKPVGTLRMVSYSLRGFQIFEKNVATEGLCYKAFYVRDLQIVVLS
jgi:hypothetical protein